MQRIFAIKESAVNFIKEDPGFLAGLCALVGVLFLVASPLQGSAATIAFFKGYDLNSVDATITDKSSRRGNSARLYYFDLSYEISVNHYALNEQLRVKHGVYNNFEIGDQTEVYFYNEMPAVLYGTHSEPTRARRRLWLAIFLFLTSMWILFLHHRYKKNP